MRVASRLVLPAVLGVLAAGCGMEPGTAPSDDVRPTLSVTVDPSTGGGFVGKGDVQLVFGWNNKALQDNAGSVQFQINAEVVTEVSWTCTNSNNENEQIRERTTTTSTQGVLSSVARERNQITGFNLLGYDGPPTIGASTTEGPPLNSCPSGPWSLTTPAGDPEVVSSSGGVQVSINGTDWFNFPAPVVP
jgi:hypothetical protein